MKHKSLRQLAKELGVSHSYLSQVKHGKRPASTKVVSKMVSNGHTHSFDTSFVTSYNALAAGESSSGRTTDSGSVWEGSNPSSPASYLQKYGKNYLLENLRIKNKSMA